MSAIQAPPPARFPWRFLLYAIVIVYLIGDLYFFGGPLRKRVNEQRAFTKYSLEQALANGWVATVNQEPITRSQLDQATRIHLFRRGKNETEISAKSLNIIRRVALQELIEDTKIRQYAAADAFDPDPEEVKAAIDAFEAQFPTPEDQAERMAVLDLDTAELHRLLEQQVRERQWIEARISESAAISESDLRDWWDRHAGEDAGVENPRLIRARHLFLSTVESDTPEREAQVREWHRLLTEGEAEFEDLVAAFSEDERTKRIGGDLGWFGPRRLPEDFAKVVFDLELGKLSAPFRTSLGWHLVEVTEIRESERLDFEALKPEIASWLRTEHRRYAIQVLMNRLTTVAVVEVFPDNFDDDVDLKED